MRNIDEINGFDWEKSKNEIEKTKEHIEHNNNESLDNYYLNSLLNSTTDPIFIVDSKDYSVKIANASAGCEGLFPGVKCHKTIHGRDIPCTGEDHPCPVSEIRKSRQPIMFEIEQEIAGRDSKIFEINAFPVFDDSGEVVAVIEYTTNITKRKKAEKELIDAKKKAEEANMLKSVIISNVSHELRTPLNGIIGFTQILMEETEIPEHKDMLDMIDRSAKRLNKTINSLMSLSELEAETFKIKPEYLNIGDVVKTSVVIFEEFVRNSEVELSYRIDDAAILAYLDEYLITQVFYNLIDNAVKYTQRGFINIEANSIKKGDDLFARFIVSDSGGGIPSGQHATIFEAFRQGSEGISRNYEGIGIGLTLTKRMVDMMGGAISVESSEGSGASFIIDFPGFYKDDIS